jgi:hypothetical protein
MPVLFVLQTAFSLWMLVDAVRRGADAYWWLIVLVPFGEFAYFFAVYLPDMRRSGAFANLFRRPPSLAELQLAYDETPSHHNRLQLAQGLFDAGDVHEAGVLFEQILDAHPDDRDALYGFARCALAADEHDHAIDALETLVAMDIAYLDSLPAAELVHAYAEADRMDDALTLAERLCRKSQRIGPRVLFATYLMGVERDEEARTLLERGLVTFGSSPAYVRRRDRLDARAAKALLRSLAG